MKAFIINYYGKKAILQLAELPIPAVNANGVLVEVHTTAINLLDSKIKSG